MRLILKVQRKINAIKTFWTTKYVHIYAKMDGHVSLGKAVKFRGIPHIINDGMLSIGDNVTVNSANWANPIGCGDKTNFQIMKEGKVTIGDYSGLSNCSITCARSVSIGNHVLIGAGVKIYDTDFHPLEANYRYGKGRDNTKTQAKPIRIDDGAFIGAGSIILKGTTIGANAIIGAGSVVQGGTYQ